MPGRDDARCRRQPDHDDAIGRGPCARRRDQLHRHRRRVLPRRVQSRSSARRWPADGARTSCSRPSSACRSGRIPTNAAGRDGGSPRPSRGRYDGCRPTGSTSTRCTVLIRTPISTRRSAPCRTSCTRAPPDFGSSNVPASGIVESRWTAERRGCERFRTEQPQYSMLVRVIEYDVLPTAQRHGIGVMTYSPLAGGWLSGRYRKGQNVTAPGSTARGRLFPGVYDATNPANAAKLNVADALAALADEAGMTLIQMAIAFVTRQRGGHLRDHRPAHARTPRHLPRRGRDRIVHRSARPHRPDRPPRSYRQRRRQPVEPEHNSAGGRRPPPLNQRLGTHIQRRRSPTSSRASHGDTLAKASSPDVDDGPTRSHEPTVPTRTAPGWLSDPRDAKCACRSRNREVALW